MEWIIAVVAVAALGVAAVAAAGGVGEMSRDPVEDVFRQQLPEGPLGADDVRGARFGTALRGYAMGQVDELLERLATEIAERDARIAQLTGPDRTGPATDGFRTGPVLADGRLEPGSPPPAPPPLVGPA
ncbi:DivIVA domain-containing protein [Friedmanniella luteola]|uniref:DivIVA domain-containing protein n=1 Tax=Friedmanniella luteola TaxID=546871 RepID=A0A1H1NHE2_9ACTN|nr:DivIVA domain-containing protein [Friedmanniella luteola]SDR98333.1 DivIVA domain-containing protein [Friedmanniella luteola]